LGELIVHAEGLCATCAFRRDIVNDRGSRFTLCLRSKDGSAISEVSALAGVALRRARN
jgi:sulfur relay (sulfurtransferase) complex TusBCD TusD component (DsrE family)